MAYYFNPFTGKLDYYRDNDDLDTRYVKKSGDTMTGKLKITPTDDSRALEIDEDMVIKAGKKLYLDG